MPDTLIASETTEPLAHPVTLPRVAAARGRCLPEQGRRQDPPSRVARPPGGPSAAPQRPPLARHQPAGRRVTLVRGLYAVPFDRTDSSPQELYHAIFEQLLGQRLVEVDDLVILTKGELTGVTGGTNSMQIVRVTRQ